MAFRIVQLTDLHLFAAPEERLHNIQTNTNVQAVLEMIRSQSEQPDLMVITGDLAHDEERATYLRIREYIEEWIPHVRIIPGNKDNRHHIRSVFPELTPGLTSTDTQEPLTFSDRLGAWRILGIDSQRRGEIPGELSQYTLNWLEAELQQHKTEPTLLFLHHPPVAVGTEWMDKIGLQHPEPLLDLIMNHSQIQLVATGHVHHDHQGKIGNTVFLTTPSAALQFKPKTEALEIDSLSAGVRFFVLDGETIQTRVSRIS